MEFPPFLQDLKQCMTLKSSSLLLKTFGLKHSFPTRKEFHMYLETLEWPYQMTWRKEQRQCLDVFWNQTDWKELVIQAIFGGGKTTMMLAMIHFLRLQGISMQSIQICAFNVCIKNEIKKKLKYLGCKWNIQTFDSIIYHLCDELGYEQNNKILDFSGKRKFVYHHLSQIQPKTDILYLFVDEAQDLEKKAYHIFQKRYPNAKKVFVGDVFQSIQKEPRESMLWYFLRRDVSKEFITFSMTDTPRVPLPILSEMKNALSTYYPEFDSTISQWTSSSSYQNKIQWHTFQTYQQVYQKMLSFIQEKGVSNVMILTFSSAITVRGALGDISRVRQFLIQHNISVNSNHKHMKDNAVFLSTANSSKGLERDYVFAFLSFPLELAFANFSDDLVVNLTTVALSRCKKEVEMYVPSFQDRFSKVLYLYPQCPTPSHENVEIQKKIIKPKTDELFVDKRENKRSMLEKEHSITEILRLSVLSFSTKSLLKSFTKKYRSIPFPEKTNQKMSLSEEDCTFLGVVFETLTLNCWKQKWTQNSASDGTFEHHEMFVSFQQKIESMRKQYIFFIKKNPSFSTLSINEQVKGSCLFAKLHLACFHKIFWREKQEIVQMIVHHWTSIRSTLSEICPKDVSTLKVQHNVSMSYLKGIVDAILLPSKELVEIYEIKASKSSEWQENALLQAILYGLCLGKSLFRIHLVNVFSKQIQSYVISLKDQFSTICEIIKKDIRQWNLDCFLSKNVTYHDSSKKTMHLQNTFFLDGNEKTQQYCLVEIISPTKTFSYPLMNDKEMEKLLLTLTQEIEMKKIIVSRRLNNVSLIFPSHKHLFRFLKYVKCFESEMNAWYHYLEKIGWNKYELESQKTFMEWESPQCCFMVQWTDLCCKYNFDF